jgi:hypothetical protein
MGFSMRNRHHFYHQKGTVSQIKGMLLRDPSLFSTHQGIDVIKTTLAKRGISLSHLTIATIRSDFYQHLSFLIDNGCLDASIINCDNGTRTTAVKRNNRDNGAGTTTTKQNSCDGGFSTTTTTKPKRHQPVTANAHPVTGNRPQRHLPRCHQCQAQFPSIRSDAKFCSPGCRQRFRRRHHHRTSML